MKLIFFLNIFVFTPWPVKKHEKKTTNDDGRQGFVPDRSTWSLLFELTRLIFQNYWSNLLCYCSIIHQCGSESMNVDMVVGPFLFMCFSNQNINITKRFYGRKNIILDPKQTGCFRGAEMEFCWSEFSISPTIFIFNSTPVCLRHGIVAESHWVIFFRKSWGIFHASNRREIFHYAKPFCRVSISMGYVYVAE